MNLHKQFIQLGLANILLFAICSYALYDHNYEMAFASALMLSLSIAPLYLKAIHNLYIPASFVYVGIAFIFASVFLGQFGGLYDRWHWYDAFLHFISALAFGLLGFLILFIYYVHNKLRFPKALILFLAFFFCLGVGAVWEIIEYGIDYYFGTNMQVNSLDDTMVDLMLNGLGAFVSITLCSIYMSKRSVPVIDNTVNAIVEEVIEENKTVVENTVNDPLASSNPRT